MRSLLSLVLLLLLAGEAAAEPVTLEYFDLPPYSFAEESRPAGPAVELANAITTGLDIPLRSEMVPIRRVNFEASNRPVIVAAIFRNPQRENRYQWIGRLCTEGFVMTTRAPNPAVDTLDEARKLKLIGVAAGATNETFLRERGFTNLDPAASIQLEARRLAEGHDDAWFVPRNGALYAWKAAGYDVSLLRFGAPIVPLEVWMAASNAVPMPLVETLRTRFAEKVKSGAVAAATGCPQ